MTPLQADLSGEHLTAGPASVSRLFQDSPLWRRAQSNSRLRLCAQYRCENSVFRNLKTAPGLPGFGSGPAGFSPAPRASSSAGNLNPGPTRSRAFSRPRNGPLAVQPALVRIGGYAASGKSRVNFKRDRRRDFAPFKGRYSDPRTKGQPPANTAVTRAVFRRLHVSQ